MASIKSFFYIKSDFLLFYFAFVIFSPCLVYSNKAKEIKRPRGISVSKASLYIPDKDFICLDGSFTIPFSQINDDYCDCPDGSDEPGTAACSNSYFHCTNAGFKPSNIPSSHVNDGVCDCCDGSDEYEGKINCINICHDLGKVERMEAQKQVEITRMGNEAKIQLIKKGKQLKKEKREKLIQLENDKVEAESIRAEKEKLKLEVEVLEKLALENYQKLQEAEEQRLKEEENKAAEQEAFAIFNLLDSNQDKIIHISELQVRQTFDQNKDGVVSEEEARFFLDNMDEVGWDSFFASGWPKMKPFFMLEKGLFKSPERNVSHADEEIIHVPREGVGTVEDVTNEYHRERQRTEEADHEGEEGEEEEEEDEEEEEEEEDAEQPNKEVEQGTEPTPPQYDEETQKLVNAANEARSKFEEADRAIRDIERQISQCHDYLEKDFGPDEEFASLEGECFEYSDREYVYKLCPFDQVFQQPRSGESETRLGQWGKWAGPEDDKYQAMLYDRGQSCWNGPQRSAYIKLKCGIDNVITSVMEPNKCEYHFDFTTPSVCKTVEKLDERLHDEL